MTLRRAMRRLSLTTGLIVLAPALIAAAAATSPPN